MVKKKFKYAYGKKAANNNEELINHYRNVSKDLKKKKRKYLEDSDEQGEYKFFEYFKENNDFLPKKEIEKKKKKSSQITRNKEKDKNLFENFDSEPEPNKDDEDDDEEDDYEEDEDEEANYEEQSLQENSSPGSSQESFHYFNQGKPGNPPNEQKVQAKKYPWLSDKTKSLSGILKLHSEILDFYYYLQPTEAEKKEVNSIVATISSLVKAKFPNFKVKLFGSNSTGLNLPNSDIDIIILPKNAQGHEHNLLFSQERTVLHQIKNQLIHKGHFRNIEIINAKVPIIKTEYKGRDIDISFGRKNGYEAVKVINKILDDYPAMRPIIILLKYYLRQRGLNITYTGGLSSFSLFTLVYGYILYLNKEGKKEIETLGHFLIGFLEFYGFKFNFDKVGIGIRYGGFFYKKNERFFSDNSNSNSHMNCLSLENFQNTNQDIGANCYRFEEVHDCFKEAYWKLGDYDNQRSEFSYLAKFIRCDRILKQRAHKLFQKNS